MDLRDITNEQALLKSYKTVFVDNQNIELIKIYRDHKGAFPVFLDRVFAKTSPTPGGFLDFRMRQKLDEQSVGRTLILERTDKLEDNTRTRLFFVWLSPKLVEHMRKTAPDVLEVNASVLLHPFGSLDKYPRYWNGNIDPVKVPNYLELGARYLCKEKQTVTQHLCAVKPAGTVGTPNGLDAKTSPLSVMVVVPVSSPAAFWNMTNPLELEDALRQIARRGYEAITSTIAAGPPPTISRVAFSTYSRSGVLLKALLDNAQRNEPFMRKVLKEIYAFDVMMDEKDRNGKVTKTKQAGYDELWSRLKAWQGDDSDKKIRLYSAEPGTVSNVYAELKSRLDKYGGGYHNQSVRFSAFNGTAMPDGKTNFSKLSDGYEIYSTDNSRSLVVFPAINSLVYLSTENLVNPGGFAPGGDYESALEGHSWFVSRLQSHALFHSGF